MLMVLVLVVMVVDRLYRLATDRLHLVRVLWLVLVRMGVRVVMVLRGPWRRHRHRLLLLAVVVLGWLVLELLWTMLVGCGWRGQGSDWGQSGDWLVVAAGSMMMGRCGCIGLISGTRR